MVNPGTHFFELDGAGVLFCESSQCLYGLNPCAAYIWCCIEEGQLPQAVAGQLIANFGLTAATANQYVEQALAQWQQAGLLGSHPGRLDIETQAPGLAFDLQNFPPYIQPQFFSTKYYRLLETTIRVSYSTGEQLSRVHPLFRHLEVEHQRDIQASLAIIQHGAGHLVYRDTQPAGRCGALDSLAPKVKSLLIQTAINASDYFVYLHAGVVSDGTRCMLLPGVAGSGKSCLTAGLVHDGFQYFSDEVALLEHQTLAVKPFPIAIGLKTGAWELLAPYFPQLPGLDIHHREDGRKVRYLPPPKVAPGTPPQDSQLVSHLIFPHYHADATLRLEPVQKALALQTLMDDCVALPGKLTRDSVEQLVNWLEMTGCYKLHYRDLPSAVKLLRGLGTA